MFALFNTWQFNLLGYFIFVVIFFQSYKVAVKNVKRDGAATILLQMIAGISILFCIPFFNLTYSSDIKIYMLLIAACIFYAINDRLQTTSRKNLPVSVFSIIGQLANVFLIVYGFTLFHNPIILTKVIAAGLILFGNILLFYKKGKFVVNRYMVIGAVASFAFATAISIDIDIAKHFNLPIYISFTLIVPALLILLIERIPLDAIYTEIKSKGFKYYVLTAIAWGLTILFALRSFQLGQVATIVPLQACSVLLNVLVASLFFGEHENLLKKIIAAIFVIVGVYFTVIR